VTFQIVTEGVKRLILLRLPGGRFLYVKANTDKVYARTPAGVFVFLGTVLDPGSV